jgi:uncharacterized protein YodC (DUF2158 family)
MNIRDVAILLSFLIAIVDIFFFKSTIAPHFMAGAVVLLGQGEIIGLMLAKCPEIRPGVSWVNSQRCSDDKTIELFDAVVINSGGPNMIVIAIRGNWAMCTWKDADGNRQYDDFQTPCISNVD